MGSVPRGRAGKIRALCPLEGHGTLVVSDDEFLDGIHKLANVSEAGPFEGTAAKNTEPCLNLIDPWGVRGCEKNMNLGVTHSRQG
jgi:hypothetical protein